MLDRYFNCHAHTMYSNLRLLDSINRPTDLIDKSIELGLSGVAITDHECLSCHMEVNQYAKEIREKYPDFKIALGNEIYLVDSRDRGQKYYHFILIAKDAFGHKGLRELSSIAWYNCYSDRNMDRVPLLKSELKETMKKYKGHIIATSACLGGELPSLAVEMALAQTRGDNSIAQVYYNKILKFLEFCKDCFGNDFYIECAPADSDEQIIANKKLLGIAKYAGVKMVIGTDAHYLRPEDRFVHSVYLNSKDGDREVDGFYDYTYVMSADEARELLLKSFDEDTIDEIFANSILMQNDITNYSLERKQMIPKVELFDYPKNIVSSANQYQLLSTLLMSDNIQERYWINECLKSLQEKKLVNDIYLERLETEADVIKCIGDKLDDCLFAYFNTFKHYIDLFWECGSIVGPGRGSSTGFLSNYLLGITQLDPIRWELPYWRFLNKERAELPDIDIDLAPSKRPAIFKAIREERGEFGLVQVATFGTEGTKSAIQTACRGYKTEEYPNGIDVDDAQYMSSLIPEERGFLWPISDVVNGNEKKGRKPVSIFINAVNQYPGLLNIISSIEGLVNKRSSHASGVILYGDDPFETAGFMRTPSGDLITCYDLHKAEAAGDTKYDFLVTEVSDKIIKCFELLQEDKIVPNGSIRELYNQFIHPEIMDTSDEQFWNHLAAGDVLDVFQFNSGTGLAVAKKVKPQNPIEMTAANALIRLMAEPGEESQQDRYARIKQQGLKVFDKEMDDWRLNQKQKSIVHKYCDEYWGCSLTQETMMKMLMDEDVSHFSLAEANDARKIVGKKQMNRIPELQQRIFDNMGDKNFANYVWKIAIKPQLGYSFSLNHALPYTFVGIQTLYLAIKFNPIYWDTACLIVNSGATDVEAGGSTDYRKIAIAIGDIIGAGIQVGLADINNSKFGFSPDVKNNQILFGLKGMLNVGDDVVAEIIKNRPYSSLKDFMDKVKVEKQAMISLIKGGAFDQLMERQSAMIEYINGTCNKKQRVTLQNMGGLLKYGLLPDNEIINLSVRVYEFNRYLKATSKWKPKFYKLDGRAIEFLTELDLDDLIESQENTICLNIKDWEKHYQLYMNTIRDWISGDYNNILNSLNNKIFQEDWDKYAQGNYSTWEMEVLCFYYHKHELAHLNFGKYGISDFFKLPEEPVVEKVYPSKSGGEIKLYELKKICGTCIAKDKKHGIVSLLTTSGVVDVRFRKEYFSLFDKQISELGEDGKKHVVEKSWFNRGNMIMVQGMRRGDEFVAKKYRSTGGHQLYKITEIKENGDIVLQDHRHQGDLDE